jgi:hypothetical protein
MKKLELLDRKTGLGTVVVSYELPATEGRTQPEGGTEPASPGTGGQPAQPSGQSGGQGGGSGNLPPIIFDPGRGMGPAFRAPKRYSDWRELASEIEHIAREARDRENRAVVATTASPSVDELHQVLARMPDNSDVVVLIDP